MTQTKRILPAVKAIADAHIEAKKSGQFNSVNVRTKAEVIEALRHGRTFKEVLEQIEIRFCSIGSILLSGHMHYDSKAYKTGVYKGFKALLQNQ
jgi:hypothetical protein